MKLLYYIIPFLIILSSCKKEHDHDCFTFGSKKIWRANKNISENTSYSNNLGYGFDFNNKEKVQMISGINSYCTADVPFYFSVKKPEGNYEVEVIFGNPSKPSQTSIKAEARRLMVKNLKAKKGETISKKFIVNVRSPQIDQTRSIRLKPREANYMNWDNRLTLEFSGENVAIHQITIHPIQPKTTLFLAGNSTVTDQDCEPWASWGQMITCYFNSTVVVSNYAESGESLQSFKNAGRLDKILSLIQPGDYLFIEFGHNDQKQTGEGIGPWLSFTALLHEYVTKTREKQAIPVLVTPAQRRSFNSEGKMIDTHGEYPDAIRKVALDLNVPLIDLHLMTRTLYESWGIDASRKAFVHYPANTFPGQDKPLEDNTHFNAFGAHEIALCVLKGITGIELGLKNQMIGFNVEYEPSQPNQFENWTLPMSPRLESTKPEGN